MLEKIKNREAVAAIDVSMSRNTLATHLILSTKSNDKKCNRGVINSDWGDGMTLLGNAIELLDLIMNIKESTKCLN